MRVIPDASQMCAVSLHAGASSRSVSALYDWNYLAAAPCILISMSNAYCYEIGGYGLVVVGHGVVRTSSSLMLLGTRRRLLLLADEGYDDDNDGINNGTSSGTKSPSLTETIQSFQAWNHTAEPCSGLVHEFVAKGRLLGVLDMQALEQCVQWRRVGQSIIRDFNLTRMMTGNGNSGAESCCSHVFMSLQDFVSVISKNKGVGLQMLQHAPGIVHALVKSTSLYATLVDLFDVIRQHAAIYYLEGIWQHVFFSNGTNNRTAFSGLNATEMQMIRKFMREHRRQIAMFEMYANEPFSAMIGAFESSSSSSSSSLGSEGGNSSNGTATYANKSMPKRRLLFESEDPVVDSYTSLVASTKGFSNIAVSSLASTRSSSSLPLITDTWLEGPFGWPPRVSSFYGKGGEGNLADGKCAAFEVGVRSTMDVMRVVKRYYETDFASKVLQQAPWDIRSNMPSLYTKPVANKTSISSNSTGEVTAMGSSYYWDVASDQGQWAPFIFRSFLGAVDTYTPWLQDFAAGFFTLQRSSSSNGGASKDALTAGNLLHDALVCDFDSVMFCGKQREGDSTRVRRNILICMVISYGMWYAVGLVLSVIPGAGMFYVLTYSFMWLLVPVTAIQLSYGMAVTCFPMVPTCAVQDIVVSLQATLPISIRWPDALQEYPGCITNASKNEGCLKSCRGDPFHFQRWEDSAAWLLCSFDAANCTGVDVPYAPMVRQAAWNYSRVISRSADGEGGGLDLWHAHQFCFFVTLGQALPWLFVALAGVYVVLSMLTLPFAVISAGVQFLMQAISFTHVE